MAKAVFTQNPDSPYDDRPGECYHFPAQYLSRVRQAVGDWVIFYEGRRGAFGYVAVQKVEKVVPDPLRAGHFFAILDPATLLEFERVVPRARPDGMAWETSLRGAGGQPMAGGANSSAVRMLSEIEFAGIVNFGCAEIRDADALPREGGPLSREAGEMAATPPGMAEAQAPFAPAELLADRESILVSRQKRDRQFARMVKRAYGGRCAISGLALRNGGGRPEVEAAHIRPVADGGPDVVRNGIALSGTLHWMFDRGLISVADDMRILVSHNKVPPDAAQRLIRPEQRLLLPENPRHHPHPEYLRYHREEIFGRVA